MSATKTHGGNEDRDGGCRVITKLISPLLLHALCSKPYIYIAVCMMRNRLLPW